MTRPADPPRELWRAALDHSAVLRPARSVRWRLGVWGGLAAALIAVVAIVMTPMGGKARRATMPLATQNAAELSKEAFEDSLASRLSLAEVGRSASAPESPRQLGTAMQSSPESAAQSARLVVRKADISLRVADVRETFLKAGLLVSQAHSEFIQDSRISGEGPAAAADLTLRVAVDRLPAVLGELRALGEVMSEKTSSDDVTERSVDLEARLRNEQRVEQELLGLLESRQAAPLQDVLKLRESIAEVRQSVERMTGERENLSRLIDLATVLVIIRAKDADATVAPDKGLGAYFEEEIGRAWRAGLIGLADSVAGFIRLGVGYLVLWLVLAGAAVVIVRVSRGPSRWAA